MVNALKNHFTLFEITEQFNLDAEALEKNYRKIQSASHPDRFVSATASEKLAAMQLATSVNEAYDTLSDPAKRAQYLLAQRGIDAIAETNTNMPADFLMQQMEWRENLEDAKLAKDIPALDALAHLLKAEANRLIGDLSDLFDLKKDYKAATEVTRKLIFINKVRADIHQAIEQLED